MSTATLEQALGAARARAGGMLDLLRRWVEVNSYTAHVAGVNEVGARLCEAFSLPGLSLLRRPGRGVGDHLCWRTPAWDERPSERILLVGHHDTVFPPGTFEVWEHVGDRLRGPGVLDMKGGLAVIHTALAALADVGALAERPLAVVSVADEETSSLDSRDFLAEVGRGAAAALVFESGRADDSIVTRRKGTGRFVVKATGRAAHAGNNPGDGINAVVALARLVDRAATLGDPDAGVTVNVGVFRGGDSVNTVPALAECQADFRFLRAADGQRLFDAVRALAEAVSRETGASLVVEGGMRRPPLERTDASAALAERYGACARAAGLGSGECGLLGGGSDASTVAAVGVPAIDGLGPRGRGFHTHDEHIEVSSLPGKVEALLRFLMS